MKHYMVKIDICTPDAVFETREEAHHFADQLCKATGITAVTIEEEESYVYRPETNESDMDGQPCPGCVG